MILIGDCIEIMRGIDAESIDAIVTDPPYGIGFMGKPWDRDDIIKRAEYRKYMGNNSPNTGPNGGHASVAASAGKYRNDVLGMRAFQDFSHEWAIEAIRILKPGGHAVVFASPRSYHRMACGIEEAGFEIRDQIMWIFGSGFPKSRNGAWGGTALKPAHEPIVMCRKPLAGPVESNWHQHRTGALNIDGCRVGGDNGRWPANVTHDGSAAVLAGFPDRAGASAPVRGTEGSVTTNVYSHRDRVSGAFHNDTGSAARFFYCAKASKAERDCGLEGFVRSPSGMVSNTSGQHITRRDEGYQVAPRANSHPTVKPTDLMRWLCRLVTPAGGVVLDPFAGSGSTGRAAIMEGFRFIGIEIDPSYAEIAEARISAVQPGLPLATMVEHDR